MSEEKTEAPKVSTNPALVEFPRDEWGFTTELRAAGLLAASSVNGNKEKQAIFNATLRVLAQHAAARLKPDADALVKYAEKIAEREASAYQRVASRGIQP